MLREYQLLDSTHNGTKPDVTGNSYVFIHVSSDSHINPRMWVGNFLLAPSIVNG